MKEKEFSYLNEIESRPKPLARISIFRHSYTDRTGDPGDVTTDGEDLANTVANKLVNEMDPEEELVVFQVSPTRRTQATSAPFIKAFEEKGIPIAHLEETYADIDSDELRGNNSLVDIKRTTEALSHYYQKKQIPTDIINERLEKRRNEISNTNPEDDYDVLKRMTRVFEYDCRISQLPEIRESGRIPRIMNFTHLNNILTLLIAIGFWKDAQLNDLENRRDLLERVPELSEVEIGIYSITSQEVAFLVNYQDKTCEAKFDRINRVFIPQGNDYV